MKNSRLDLTDNINTILSKMADGNIGALTVLMQMVDPKNDRIDIRSVGHTESADIGGYSLDISRRFDYLNKVVGANLTIKKKNSDGTFTVKKVISDYKTLNEAKKDAINRVNEINGVGIETLKVKRMNPIMLF